MMTGTDPHAAALDREMRIVGAIMRHPSLLAGYAALAAVQFKSFPGRLVFGAIRNVEARSEAPDLEAVIAELARVEKLDALTDGRRDGARARLAERVDAAPADVEVAREVVDAHVFDVMTEHDVDQQALRNDEPIAPLPLGLSVIDRGKQPSERPPRAWRRCRELVDEIIARSAEPWVKLRLGGDEICEVRSGGIVLLVGGTGRGKTSLAASILVEHADCGPAIACSLELPDDEWTARAIGTQREASWPDVLKGRVSRDGMLSALPERLAIIGRDVNAFDALEQAIEDLRAEYSKEPILVAVDYVQIAALDGDAEIRQKVGQVMRRLDRIARTRAAVVIALSQGSRVSSRALSSGEKIGADTTDSGAESADLERWATVTLAIGQLGDAAADGTAPADISIGKGRMTGGDRVLPGRFDGRTGRWRLAGEARPANEVRAEKTSTQANAKAGAALLAMVAAAERSATSMTREELRAAAAANRSVANAAILAGLKTGELVEVHQRKPRTSAWQIWTPSKAKTAGVATVGSEAKP